MANSVNSVFVVTEEYRDMSTQGEYRVVGVFTELNLAQEAFNKAKSNLEESWSNLSYIEWEIDDDTDESYVKHDEDYELYYNLQIEKHDLNK